jgi:hypothetical protein
MNHFIPVPFSRVYCQAFFFFPASRGFARSMEEMVVFIKLFRKAHGR